MLRQQKIKEKQERDRLLKMEAEAAAAAKRAEALAKAEAQKASLVAEGQAKAAENGDGAENPNRSSGRAKPKKDYSTIHRGTSNDFSKPGSFPGKGAPASGSGAGSSKAQPANQAKQRGI